MSRLLALQRSAGNTQSWQLHRDVGAEQLRVGSAQDQEDLCLSLSLTLSRSLFLPLSLSLLSLQVARPISRPRDNGNLDGRNRAGKIAVSSWLCKP